MKTQTTIATPNFSDAFVGQGGCWQYGATSAAVFGSAGRFSKSQPPRRVAFSAPSSLSQRAIPLGYYDIVDNNADTRHFGWFRLDRQDKNRYNDKDDIENRDGYRFHLGKESWGCVTIDNSQEDAQEIWSVIDAIFKSTSKTRVKEKRGRQGWIPWSRLVRYGTLTVRGVDNIPIE